MFVDWCEEALLRCFDMDNLTLHLSSLTSIEVHVLFTFNKIKKHFNLNAHRNSSLYHLHSTSFFSISKNFRLKTLKRRSFLSNQRSFQLLLNRYYFKANLCTKDKNEDLYWKIFEYAKNYRSTKLVVQVHRYPITKLS